MYTQEELYIRDLAKEVLEAANTPKNIEIIKRFEDINSLKPAKPPVLTQLPYQIAGRLLCRNDLKSRSADYQNIERELRFRLDRLALLTDDMPVSPIFHTGFYYTVSEWREGYHRVILSPQSEASRYEPCINSPAEYLALNTPEISYDKNLTDEKYQKTADLLGDILAVSKGSPFGSVCGWGESMIDQLVDMRGLENFYYDTIDCPDAIHSAMEFMTRGHLKLLAEFEELGLLVANNGNNGVGSCSLGYSRELGVPSDYGGPVSMKNLWGYAHAQELSLVSRDMLEEFVLPYQARILEKFGLNAYGCCEAMEHKIESAAKFIPKLRMISISPFADHEAAGEKCRGKYVYAWKPQPSNVAYFNGDAIRGEFVDALKHTEGCCLAVILMDVHELGDLSSVREFVKIANEMIERMWRT